METEEPQAQPAMLVLARESRGLTQSEIAARMTASADAAVSQGYVSRAEAGRLVVSAERLALYAAALGYPVSLLCQDPFPGGVGVGLVHHRKRASLSATALRRIHAQLALTRLQVQELLCLAPVAEVPARFPWVELTALVTPREAARQVRTAWDLPPGPLENLVVAAERAGALVVKRDLGSDLLDAVSQWDGFKAPLIMLNAGAPGDRLRFSLAHEIGHLVMHRSPGKGTEQEKQADIFASELLMPAASIRESFGPRVDLSHLGDLKRRWRVSMAALARRAQDLGVLSEWQYRNLLVEMSALGYRTAEPVTIDREQPGRLPHLVRTCAQDSDLSMNDLAACAHLLPEDFQELYPGASTEHLSPSSLAKARP